MAATAGALDGVHGWDEVDGLRDTMSRTLRLAGIHLALAAMLLRAMLPDGWMPNTSGVAGGPMVLCTMNGPASLAAGMAGGPSKNDPANKSGRASDVCPFSVAPHFATIAPAIAASPSVETAFLAAPVLRAVIFDAAQRHTPQSPRAPPSFV